MYHRFVVPRAPRTSLRTRLSLAGAVLGAAAIANWLVARSSEGRHPPMGDFVTIRGVRLHYVDLGPKDSALPPAVLVHGNGTTAHEFIDSGVPKMLARERRVIVFERPGAGYSERPRGHVWTVRRQAALIRDALSELGVRKPVVVGHSFGTLVALSLATEMRHEISGLVLLSGYYYPSIRLDALLLSLPAIPVIGDLYRYTIAPLAGWLMAPRLVRKVFAPSPVPRSFRAFPVSLALRPWQLRATSADSALMIFGAAELWRRYREIRLPVAIVAGASDQIVEVAQSRRLHREIPDSTLHLVAGAGHMPHHLNPLLVAAAIDAIESKGTLGGAKQVSIVQRLRTRERAEALWRDSGQPAGGLARYLRQAAEDIRQEEAAYDEALADSFPASDPPAHTGFTGQSPRADGWR
jgi:pimeloyl-ACP methyl ester carboxylesterase